MGSANWSLGDEEKTMKSDFKKSSPIDGKDQIRNEEDHVESCARGCILTVCDDF